MAHILVVYEIVDQKIKKASFEATSAAAQLAADLNGTVSALFVGPQVNSLAGEAGTYGAEKSFVVEHAGLEKYSPDAYAAVIAEAARQAEATHIFMGASSRGKDLLPRVAYLLDSALAQDIISIDVEGDKVVYTRPIIAGKLRARVTIDSQYQLATLRPNVFPVVEKATNPETVSLSIEPPAAKAVVEEVLTEAGGKLDVTEAEIIVSGGRGMKGPENWHLIEDLAGTLGAATGASRAAVDAGWRDHAEQVGQTGKTVSPNLYIACGISGAIQHQAGMSSSKYIVAINKDPEAPIFKIADYGIVGDVFEVLPKLNEEILKLKSE